MKLKLKSLIAGLLCVFTLFTGCATDFFTKPSTNQVLAKIAVQQATLRFIQKDGDEVAPKRAAAVVSVVDKINAVLESDLADTEITAAELQKVLEHILPSDLTTADQLLISQLSALVVAEVNARIPDTQAQLPIAEISAVLEWVREAAVLVAPDCSGTPGCS